MACFSAVHVDGALAKSRCRLSMETSSPPWDHGPATVPKRCHKRNLKATFSNPCASLWAAVAKKSALCGNHSIYNVLNTFCASWRVPFHTQMDSRMQCAPEGFFLSLLFQLLVQSDAQGRPKAGPRVPKGTTRTTKDTPETSKNQQKISLRSHLVIQGRPGGSRGTPQ